MPSCGQRVVCQAHTAVGSVSRVAAVSFPKVEPAYTPITACYAVSLRRGTFKYRIVGVQRHARHRLESLTYFRLHYLPQHSTFLPFPFLLWPVSLNTGFYARNIKRSKYTLRDGNQHGIWCHCFRPWPELSEWKHCQHPSSSSRPGSRPSLRVLSTAAGSLSERSPYPLASSHLCELEGPNPAESGVPSTGPRGKQPSNGRTSLHCLCHLFGSCSVIFTAISPEGLGRRCSLSEKWPVVEAWCEVAMSIMPPLLLYAPLLVKGSEPPYGNVMAGVSQHPCVSPSGAR